MIIASMDPAAVEYGRQPPQLTRAASHVLQRLAEEGLLQQVLQKVRGWESASAPPALEDAFGEELVRSLEETTGFGRSELIAPVLAQLGKVAAFALSDGGSDSDNFRAAEYLIRSGRVSLFSR